jgi:hypothetical protein
MFNDKDLWAQEGFLRVTLFLHFNYDFASLPGFDRLEERGINLMNLKILGLIFGEKCRKG